MWSLQQFLAQPRLARFPFLFIVTYGRSGSTLLLGLLNSLPGYQIRGENHGAMFLVFRATERLRQTRFRFGLEENGSQNPWYGAHLVAPDLFAQACGDAFFQEVVRPPLGTRACGFKEIRYTPAEMSDEEFPRYLDFLRTTFPGAGFIFNVRDVEATSGSGWWRNNDPAEVTDRLQRTLDRMLRYAQDHPSYTHVFDYDHLTSDPNEFASLCDFLGEEFDEEVVSEVLARRHSVMTPTPSRPPKAP